MNIQEQRDWLKKRLEVELLTKDKTNESAIQNFTAGKQGKGLERYLKEYAWEEDNSGVTKVYLVKDAKTKEIVFFFALKAGLLYRSIGDEDSNLTEKEREIVDLCVECRLNKISEYTEEDVFSWYENEDMLDKEKLYRVIDEKTDLKLRIKADRSRTAEEANIMRVSETFPGIVLTHFCRNTKYSPQETLSFPLGFYVFWEIIAERVCEISTTLGCQYLYLFAADTTQPVIGDTSLADYVYGDMVEEKEESVPVYKLVKYYKNELKFGEVEGMTILKPVYDYECFSLVQAIQSLQMNRAAAWIQHSDIER